jgi:hypothetical protein
MAIPYTKTDSWGSIRVAPKVWFATATQATSLAVIDRQVKQEPLRDASDLDVQVIGVHLAADLPAVVFGLH